MTENNETMIDSRIYEVSFILDNKLDQDVASTLAEGFKKSIATLKGSFISEETPYMRELAYEMSSIQNNINVYFNEGYFGWIKFEMDADKVKEFEKFLKLEEKIIRFLVVKTLRENTVYTKRAPVIKAETLINNEDGGIISLIGDDVNPDTTKEVVTGEIKEEAIK